MILVGKLSLKNTKEIGGKGKLRRWKEKFAFIFDTKNWLIFSNTTETS